MNRGGFKFDPERAKAIGRSLFQKYDATKRGVLQPRQCYQVFSDFVFRILNVGTPPTIEQAESMHQILDANRDKRVTQQDFQNLALRYLCNQAPSSRFESRGSTVTVTSTTISMSRQQPPQPERKLTAFAKKRLDVVRRLFALYDKDKSGFLTEQQIPLMLTETYKDMGGNYSPTKEDVRSYMRMVDKDGDGKITIDEFQEIVLLSLEKTGMKIYE